MQRQEHLLAGVPHHVTSVVRAAASGTKYPVLLGAFPGLCGKAWPRPRYKYPAESGTRTWIMGCGSQLRLGPCRYSYPYIATPCGLASPYDRLGIRTCTLRAAPPLPRPSNGWLLLLLSCPDVRSRDTALTGWLEGPRVLVPRANALPRWPAWLPGFTNNQPGTPLRRAFRLPFTSHLLLQLLHFRLLLLAASPSSFPDTVSASHLTARPHSSHYNTFRILSIHLNAATSHT